MKKISYLFVFLSISMSFSACFEMDNRFTALAPGVWRGVLQLYPKDDANRSIAEYNDRVHNVRAFFEKKGIKNPEALQLQEVNDGELPFAFEVKYVNDTSFYIELINGEERLKVEPQDIKYGRDRATGKDTVWINFPVFGSYLRCLYQERVMEGEWVVPAKGISIPFKAQYGKGHRFSTLAKKPTADLTGVWDATFNIQDSAQNHYKAIGELRQNGNILRGTFRTETGDYRFLEGEVQGDKMFLSCFDGSHAFLFEAKIMSDGSLTGFFRSGKSGFEMWEARRNDKAALRNAEELTKVAAGNETIDFSFQNAEGKQIGLKDYGNKVKIIQVFGTWCPNCFDETRFLTDYLSKNQNPNLAVLALAFERNAEVAAKQVTTYKDRMKVPYEILIAGTTTSKAEAAKKLPFLDKVVAYPTMIFVDKNNKIRKIHTGFDGPATSKYADFTKDFDMFVKALLSE